MATATQIVPIEEKDGSRIVRIPEDFLVDSDRVTISQNGVGRLTLESFRNNVPDILALLHSWEPLPDEDAMPEIKDYPPEPVEL